MTKPEQLEALQSQMDLLKAEVKIEVQAKILPFIREGKATCNFHGSFTEIFITLSTDNERELIKYIEGNQDSGFYHFGCPLSDVSEIRYDDGRINIYFAFGGKVSEVRDKFLTEVKALGIKVDFTEHKSELMRQVKQKQDALASALLLEGELTDNL